VALVDGKNGIKGEKQMAKTKKSKEKQYIVFTSFVDGTFENEIINLSSNQTVDDIAQHKLEKYDQFYVTEDSKEPKVTEIKIFEIASAHKYFELNTLYSEAVNEFKQIKKQEVNE